jgi:hypothetical protein
MPQPAGLGRYPNYLIFSVNGACITADKSVLLN